MTKGGRRALFLLVATVANFVATCLILAVLMILWNLIAGAFSIAQDSVFPAFMVAFLIAVIGSGVIYSKVLKYISNKPELVERFGIAKK